MIVSRIIGGLGNQMFQYALGKKLAILNNTELYLDINFYKGRTKETDKYLFELDKFNIKAKIFNGNKNDLNIIKEKDFTYDKDILNVKDNSYLMGYWQTEKYFKDIKNILQKDFTLKEKLFKEYSNNLNENDKNCLDKLVKKGIALHVRRDDNITNKSYNRVHGVCSIDYYKRVNEVINKLVKDNFMKEPIYFIFSDEISWAKKNFDFLSNKIFVYNNENHVDFFLMNLCSLGVIMANSTFSWWGAWLNRGKKNKVIFAPKKWFNDSPHNIKDIIPENWVKL